MFNSLWVGRCFGKPGDTTPTRLLASPFFLLSLHFLLSLLFLLSPSRLSLPPLPPLRTSPSLFNSILFSPPPSPPPPPALEALKKEAVVCSGSTLGSYSAVHHYIRTMLSSMDTVKVLLHFTSLPSLTLLHTIIKVVLMDS